MDINIITLMGYLLNPVTAIISWLASSRMRRNDAINKLQETVDTLISKNAELTEQVISLRTENAGLHQGQMEMKQKLLEVRNENARLEKLLKQYRKK